MNPNLLIIRRLLEKGQPLSDAEKKELETALGEVSRMEELNKFKLDRTIDDKRILSVMLDETIEDLERKRKHIEQSNVLLNQSIEELTTAQKQLENKNKELEVEAALEKVRSRSLAMHKSEELQEIVNSVFERLKELNIEMDSANIAIFKEGTKDLYYWIASPVQNRSAVFHISNNDFGIVRDLMNAKAEGKDFFEKVYPFEEKNEWFKYAFKQTDFKYIGEERQKFILDAPAYALSFAISKNTGVQVNRYSNKTLSDVEVEILKRFTKVFEQAYIRFLDLQKAEAQAREAQIEAALERVRSRTMAMQHSDELQQAANLLFQQVKALGLPILTCGYNIWEKDQDVCTAWMSGEDGNIQPSFQIPLTEYPTFKRFNDSRQKGESFFVEEMSGKQLESFYQYMLSLPGFAEIIAKFNEAGFSLPPSQINNVANFSHGNLTFVTYQPVPEAWPIFNRFASVFEQTYTRFLDLQKAEAQTREAQIELGLERVRARAMAMQKSGELAELVATVFKELTKLHFVLDRCILSIIDENSMSATYWMANPELDKTPVPYWVKLIDVPYLEATFRAWKERNPKWVYDLKGDEKKRTAEFMLTQTEMKFLPDAAKKGMKDTGRIFLSSSYNNFGGLQADTIEPLSEENLDILYRFSKVFDLTYTRFNDLQTAEAQAKEAKIELALERVRAVAMAMHNSEELSATVHVFFNELKTLGITPIRCGVGEVDEEKRTSTFSVTTALQQGESYEIVGKLELDGHPVLKSVFDHWKLQQEYHPVLKGSEIKAYYQVMKPQLPLPEYADDTIQYGNYFYFKEGFVFAWTENELTNEESGIFRRFTTVLSLTYRRYLDIKKAEAQAREAQIEAALEKVRSRSLAMHKSDELREVVAVVFEKLSELGIAKGDGAVGIFIFTEGTEDHIQWIADPGQSYASFFRVPHSHHSISADLADAHASGMDFFSKLYTIEEKNEYFNYLFEQTSYSQIPDEIKTLILSSKDYGVSGAFAKNSAVVVYTNIGNLVTGGDKEVLKRFARVFEQAYVRFLDLQKAEQQAREAQIEAALEKVRSRTMAMQRSDELPETAAVLFQEFKKLGEENLIQITIGIYNEEERLIEFNVTNWAGGGERLNRPFNLSMDEPILLKPMIAAWKAGEKSHVADLSGELLEGWLNYRNKITGLSISSKDTGGRRVVSIAFFSRGHISISTPKPITNETLKILEKFAGVFDGTYTRFLDLQKAEAQSRESQIQLALERVRARTMAMHKSEELAETAEVLYNQLKELGDDPERISVVIPDENQDEVVFWLTDQSGSHLDLRFMGGINEPTVIQKLFNSWKAKCKSLVVDLQGIELAEWLKYVGEVMKLPVDLSRINGRRVHTAGFFSHGWIMISSPHPLRQETVNILERFASVFNLTYRRFLDLKNAEAQAKEAQIEAALEKVRSRSLAIHKSDELKEVVAVTFEKLLELGIAGDDGAVGILIFSPGTRDHTQWIADPGHTYATPFTVPYSNHSMSTDLVNGWETGADFFSKIYPTEEKNEYFKYLFEKVEEYTQLPDEVKKHILSSTTFGNSVAFAKNSALLVPTTIGKLVTGDDIDILKRFAKVFEQAYIRFLDLQKAEAQAKDAQIEAALERVRSKTMAMHSSEDVGNTVAIMFDQLVKLGVTTNRCGILIFSDTTKTEVWTAKSNPNGDAVLIVGHLDVMIHPMLQGVREAWEKNDSFFSYELADDNLIDYYTAINNFPGYPTRFNLDSLSSKENHSDFFFPEGAVFAFTSSPIPAEISLIFKKFAGVFGQTYRRYLDLKKAEANARQAQIETAMEKVRARSLAMQKPEELKEVAQVLRKEMGLLGVEELETSSIYIHHENSQETECWYAIKDIRGQNGKLVADHMTMNLQETWVGKEMLNFYYSDEKQVSILMQGENRKEWINYCAELSQSLQGYYGESIPERTYHLLKFSNGYMGAASPGNISAESWELLQRATSVFSLAYTRFLDLQQAEASARESKIEASLERVRASTMAMHSSDDVIMAAATMFTELEKLGIENARCGFANIHSDRSFEVWSVTNAALAYQGEKPALSKSVKGFGSFSMDAHPMWKRWFEGWQNQSDLFYYFLTGKEKEEYVRILNDMPGYLSQSIQQFPDMSFQAYYFTQGAIWTFSLNPHSEEDKQLMKRFASVFSLTFRRYQDLKKAEAQAREATIETALEKVRGKAMAMNDSKDLSSTAVLAFAEVKKLGIKPLRFGVGLINKELHKAQLYSATSSDDGDGLALIGWIDFKGHPVIENIYDYWIRNEDYFPVLEGEELRSYYEKLLSGLTVPKLPDWQSGEIQYGHFFQQSVSCLYAWADQPFDETDKKILKRFASIIELTFKRYLELQKSEAAAKEAVKQAALDRVRAEIASMRSTKDLESITPLIWNELKILGVSFIRCGVFIMDENNKLIHTFLSTSDGKAIGAFHLPYSTPGKLVNSLNYWHKNTRYIDHWTEDSFKELADILVKQGAISSPEQYLGTIPHGGIYLHLLPFSQGMLYVGNSTQLGEEEIELVQSVAEAFSTAYARYEDFNKLEAAKVQVEKTLTDLRQAQTQLVQAEKMASLGELTAGIAHEIQNPLNFVNNFSDVSNELLEEMKTELQKGNANGAIAIVDDIKQNLEKILHHGQRADSIVKGMLQHSRSSTGQKELADINALADEYLRLAYHGLRAKDKSFNATLKTDFDSTIGKVSIISQDIGRVLLNLINNAFYAVSERYKANGIGYQPTVSISTKKVNNKVEIRVADNGSGIPQHIVDKIFQPFFTTKPTGQGTGLGLSLAYDIIKAHGGEVRVETSEGVGSEFIIQLPIV